jgi:hypothetical protein
MILPLVPHTPCSTEDIYLQAPQKPLAKSLAIPRFFPSLAYLSAKSIHICTSSQNNKNKKDPSTSSKLRQNQFNRKKKKKKKPKGAQKGNKASNKNKIKFANHQNEKVQLKLLNKK